MGLIPFLCTKALTGRGIYISLRFMAKIVMKFGGSSVGSIDLIKSIAAKIAATKAEDDRLILVVSAMAKTTDELWNMAHMVSERPSRREMDMLLTAGERITMSLMSFALQEHGLSSISFTGSQSGIITDNQHGNARIQNVNAFRIEEELDKGKIVIVAGFQGVSGEKEITTLGRGGSDTSAVALACFTKADRCEIYTNVDGIYSADPSVVPDAILLSEIDYDSMLALAYGGSKVMHPRAVEFALKYEIPVSIKSSFSFNEGTLMTKLRGKTMENRVIDAIAHKEGLIRYILSTKDKLNELLDIGSIEIFRYYMEGGSLELIIEAKYESEMDYLLQDSGIKPLSKEANWGFVIPVGLGINLDPVFLARILKLCAGRDVHRISHTERSIEIMLPSDQVKDCVALLHKELLGDSK